MSIKLIGRVPILNRVESGLWGFDRILGDEGYVGFPTRGGIEVFGDPETGKSTLAYYLGGKVHGSGQIGLVDFEVAARQKYLISAVGQSGFEGEIIYIDHEADGQPRLHWPMMREGADLLLEKDCYAVILDSAALVTPAMEREEEEEKSFMGRRAQLINRFNRRWVPWIGFVQEEKLVIIVNHSLDSFDAFGGVYSPGGKGKDYGVNAKLLITRAKVNTLSDGTFMSTVHVHKLRTGGRNIGRKAPIAIIPNIGISPEMTAVWDTFKQKVGRSLAGTGMVQVKDENGKWLDTHKMLTLSKRAKDGKKAPFAPFYEALGRLE